MKREIQFPLTLQKGDEVQVAINWPTSLASKDKLLLEFMLENDERDYKAYCNDERNAKRLFRANGGIDE